MRKKLLFILTFGLAQSLYSQADSLLFARLYTTKPVKDASELIYNGQEHTGYHPSIQGSAYYSANGWQKGTLHYQGVFYKDVPLRYDLVADALMVRHPNGVTGVILFTPRIQSFTLDSSSFVHLKAINNSPIQPGIYEEAVKGNVTLYIRRTKVIKENYVSNTIEKSFLENKNFYIAKNGMYYPIKKINSALELLKDKKGELNARLKESGLNFRNNPEGALIMLVNYYNQLSL